MPGSKKYYLSKTKVLERGEKKMKKKIALLGVLSVATASVALSFFAFQGQVSLLESEAIVTSYTITIHPTDITSATTSETGTATLKTDQLKNDITFAYKNVSYTDYLDGGLYLQGNGYGKIYNEIGNEVRSIESITLKAANDAFTVKWGFKNELNDSIEYTNYEWKNVTPEGTTFDLNGDKPNYFSIESGNTWDDLLYEIIITYDINCVEGTNN